MPIALEPPYLSFLGAVASGVAPVGGRFEPVVSDLLAGAAELLSPRNDSNHWDVVEGQGSLIHSSLRLKDARMQTNACQVRRPAPH